MFYQFVCQILIVLYLYRKQLLLFNEITQFLYLIEKIIKSFKQLINFLTFF